MFIGIRHQSYAGKPNSSGLKSSMDFSTSVASFLKSAPKFSSGIIIACIPAARAPLIPCGESSNTRH